MSVSVACPAAHKPDAAVAAWAAQAGSYTCTEDVLEAAAGADILYTDVWASMGQESEAAERRRLFAGYQINADVMRAAAPRRDGAALPARRTRARRSRRTCSTRTPTKSSRRRKTAWHAQKAVMVRLMKDKA